jgi:hypothetical protein
MGGEPSAALRWRIPTQGDPHALRLAMAQIALAAVVCALILMVAAPREILGPALMAVVPVAVFMAYRKWRSYQRSLAGPDNVWLDEAGVHWLDAAGGEHVLARAELLGFRVAVEEDTLRPVPALTLHLAGGLESQPLELHPPAAAENVRQLLAGQWGLAERPEGRGSGDPGYDLAIDLYSECHDEFQEWHLEGTGAALAELLDVLAEVARLPPSPAGVKPPRRVVLARRREASRLSIEHDRRPRVGQETIAGPAELLTTLAAQGRDALASAATGAKNDLKFDLVIAKGNRWTFHLHVRA